jgi:hypothetical protein
VIFCILLILLRKTSNERLSVFIEIEADCRALVALGVLTGEEGSAEAIAGIEVR